MAAQLSSKRYSKNYVAAYCTAMLQGEQTVGISLKARALVTCEHGVIKAKMISFP
jgi:hypothetical protein